MKKLLKVVAGLMVMWMWFVLCLYLSSTFPLLIGLFAILLVVGEVGIIWGTKKIGWW